MNNMTIERINIDQVKPNPNNPRIIKDDKFKKLVKSIKEFPEMLEARPIVVDDNMIVLGGNMRLKACKEAGLKEVSIIKFNDLSEEKKKEFIIKDNVGYGEWDYTLLNTWDKELLLNSGFDSWQFSGFDDIELENKMKKAIEDGNFDNKEINVDDFIKQNIFFLNEKMIEFEDDTIKNIIREGLNEGFLEDLKKLIIKHGKNIR
jgi:ParB-like chromosome segregation protein Spo0J